MYKERTNCPPPSTLYRYMHTSGYVSSYVCARTMKWITWETKQVIKKKRLRSVPKSLVLAPPRSHFIVYGARRSCSAAFVGLVTKRQVAVVTERSCRLCQQCHLGSGAVPSVVQVHYRFVFKVRVGVLFLSEGLFVRSYCCSHVQVLRTRPPLQRRKGAGEETGRALDAPKGSRVFSTFPIQTISPSRRAVAILCTQPHSQ